MRESVKRFRGLLACGALLCFWTDATAQAKKDSTSSTGAAPAERIDARLSKLRTLNDKHHPWSPGRDLTGYDAWFERTRTRLLVGLGLWPLPPRTPLNAVVHGAIDKGEYTVEKVFFESLPGHYVAGNLYRPKGKPGRRAAVLNPHGHWNNGRMYDAGEKQARADIAGGGEKFLMNARYPMQAIPIGLVRLGCVVFTYDMIGYADSTAVGHNDKAFTSTDALLRMQSIFGLQTWNSIRALDFLESLPDVDKARIGVTGASGGGTQTFMLCALDDRPAAAFPAVMVSTAMQGGCICENAPLIRVGSSNVEIAAMFAPRPLGMSGANDWTREIETKGLPELKRHYALFRSEPNVMAKCFPQFGHNYNLVARELMNAWFNRHLDLGVADVKERPIDAIEPAALSVFDSAHPRPKNEMSGAQLQAALTKLQADQLASKDWKSTQMALALRSLVDDFDGWRQPPRRGGFDPPKELSSRDSWYRCDDYRLVVQCQDRSLAANAPWATRAVCGITSDMEKTKGIEEFVPALFFVDRAVESGARPCTGAIIWATPRGSDDAFDRQQRVNPRIEELLRAGLRVIVPDVLGVGRHRGKLPPADRKSKDKYAGYALCYNRPLVAERVRDLGTTLAAVRDLFPKVGIGLVGLEDAGVWATLAGAIDGACFLVVDWSTAGATESVELNDPTTLPGLRKYGGLSACLEILHVGPVLINAEGRMDAAHTTRARERLGLAPLPLVSTSATDSARAAVAWILSLPKSAARSN